VTYLLNTWYFAAWARETTERPLMARTIVGEDLVIFRAADGAVSVLADVCPHRFAPLSAGVVANGVLTCGYHGLGFDGRGQCVANPHGPAPKAAQARAYPSVERHAAVWVWVGTPELADPSVIPDLGFIDAKPPEQRIEGLLHTKANYQLMVDNIMDLTHADYLHPDTLGGGVNTRAKMQVEKNGREVIIRWSADADTLPPAQNSLLPEPGHPADFRNEVYWREPGVMRQRVFFGPTGRLEDQGIDSWTMHTMTPETETTTHYFYCHTSDSLTADPTIAPVIEGFLHQAFAGEDAPMLEAQQRKLGDRDFWSMRPVLLNIDSGAVRSRRALDALIEKEREVVA